MDAVAKEYSVEIHPGVDDPFTASLLVYVVPDKPMKWQILFSGAPVQGIMVGPPGELCSRIKGIIHNSDFGSP